MSIKGLVFDFDGLILDTEMPEYLAWKEIYGKYGTELPLQEWVKTIGSDFNVFDPYTYLEDRAGVRLDRPEIATAQRQRVIELVHRQQILPGVIELLEAARAKGLKIALASSSFTEKISAHLKRLQLREYFDVVCTGDQVERVKPDPMLYRCAVEKLGIQPCEAVALEDSLNGIISAKGAGLYCVAVPSQLTGHLDFSRADLVVPSLSDLPLEDLLRRFNSIN